jgi:hypothetical protein
MVFGLYVRVWVTIAVVGVDRMNNRLIAVLGSSASRLVFLAMIGAGRDRFGGFQTGKQCTSF